LISRQFLERKYDSGGGRNSSPGDRGTEVAPLGIAEMKQLLQSRLSKASDQDSRGGSSSSSSSSRERERQLKEINKHHKNTVIKEVVISSDGLTVRELASKLSMKFSELRDRLSDMGEETAEGDTEALLDPDVAELLVRCHCLYPLLSSPN
jgi:hypothetical protein